MSGSTLKEKLKYVQEEITSFSFWKAVRCEFLITLMYVFYGCGSLTHIREPGQDTYLRAALTFGLAEATLVQCVGHISGAHMNPAITIAMLVTGKLSVARAIFYMVAQVVGAITGAGILYGCTPERYHGFLGVTIIKESIRPGQAFAVEFMVTFVLVFTYFANLEPKRLDMGSRSLSIGLSVCLGHLFAFDYTGCGMNPARSLGPAVITHQWKDHWVYWVGPMLGGIIGGFTYEYTQCSSEELQRFRNSFRRKQQSRGIIETGSRCESPTVTELSFTAVSQGADEMRL